MGCERFVSRARGVVCLPIPTRYFLEARLKNMKAAFKLPLLLGLFAA